MSVIFDRNGQSGNIWFIMGEAHWKLMRKGRGHDAEEMVKRVQLQDSYEAALKVIGEYVNLIDATR